MLLVKPTHSSGSTEAVAHLASDDARWVNGQTLQVNGGIL
jgi:NAD(P)-dependent dehydrogenase (short-subunit alcohol dehydrogenase family)